MSKCFECDYDAVIVYCETCKYYLCRACNVSRHITANPRPSSAHLFYLICEECEEKKRTCLCNMCDESFCDTCFEQLHKKGNRKLHAAIKVDPVKNKEIFSGVALVGRISPGVVKGIYKCAPHFDMIKDQLVYLCPGDTKKDLEEQLSSEADVRHIDRGVLGNSSDASQAIMETLENTEYVDVVLLIALPKSITKHLTTAFPAVKFQVVNEVPASRKNSKNAYEAVFSPNHHLVNKNSAVQTYTELANVSKLSKMINSWENSFFVKHKLKHPIYHIYNDITALDHEGKRYMKIIQKELHIQALKGNLKHIKTELLCSLQRKFDLSIIKLQTYIKKAIDHNIIYEQLRDFSHSHKLEFVSLKGSFLFSHENFLWIVKSLYNDRIDLSDSMVLNRIKDVFDLELSKEFLYEYYDDYIKLKQLCEAEKLKLFNDLAVVKNDTNNYSVVFYTKAERKLCSKSVDTGKQHLTLDGSKRGRHMSLNYAPAANWSLAANKLGLSAVGLEQSVIRRVYSDFQNLAEVSEADENYLNFKEFIAYAFNHQLDCLAQIHHAKHRQVANTDSDSGARNKHQLRHAKTVNYNMANDLNITEGIRDPHLTPNRQLMKNTGNIFNESSIRKTLTTESNHSALIPNNRCKTNSNMNKSQSDIQIDCLNNDMCVRPSKDKEMVRMLGADDTYLLRRKALSGGQYALALYAKYSGWNEIKSLPLGRILAFIKKAIQQGLLCHYKTFLLLDCTFTSNQRDEQTKQKRDKLLKEFESQIAAVMASYGNMVSMTDLPGLIDRFCTIKLADFAPFGIRKLKALLELLNQEKFTLKEIKNNKWVLISHQNTIHDNEKLMKQSPTSFMSNRRKRNKRKRNLISESFREASFQRNMSINEKKKKLNVSTVDGLIYKVKMALFQILNQCEIGIELGQLERKLSEELVSDFDYISFGYDNFYTFLLDNMSQFIEIEVKYANKHEFKYFIYLKNKRFGIGKKNRYVLPSANDPGPNDNEAADIASPKKNMNQFLTKLLGQHSQIIKEPNTMEEPALNNKRTSNISINFTLNQLLKAEEHQNLSSFNLLGKIKAPNSIVISTEEGQLIRH